MTGSVRSQIAEGHDPRRASKHPGAGDRHFACLRFWHKGNMRLLIPRPYQGSSLDRKQQCGSEKNGW